MTRHLLLILIAIATFAILLWGYGRSENKLARNQTSAIHIFMTAKQFEDNLEMDVLKSKGFLSLTYDGMAAHEAQLATVCGTLMSDELKIYKASAEVSHAIDGYCLSVDRTLERIEEFKSRNAVLRNSVYFVKGLATAKAVVGNAKLSALTSLSLSFALLPTLEAQDALREAIVKLEERNGGTFGTMDQIVSHAKIILEGRNSIEILTGAILNSENDELLDNIRELYLQRSSQTENDAMVFRRVLVAACAAFLILVVYSAIQLWQASRLLERRVLERTADLEASKAVVINQQHTLVAAAKTSALGEMAGQIAHEINTPLGAIILTVQGVGRKASAGTLDLTEASAKMDFILQITNKIARIIGSMRKMAGHGGNEQIQEVSINDLIEDTLLLCEGRFKKSGIQFNYKRTIEAGATVQCRANEVAQVLVNLLNNAHDAVMVHNERLIELRVAIKNSNLLIEVEDSGPEISSEIKQKLFTPNFTTKSLDHGTGFGLSISKRLIEKHGGAIYLDQTRRHTVFICEIPLRQTEALARAVGA